MRGSRGSGRGGRGNFDGGDMRGGGRGRQPGEPFMPSNRGGGERGDGEGNRGGSIKVH